MADLKQNELQRQRQEKLSQLKNLYPNIYPQPNLENKLNTTEANDKMDQQVLIAGRLMSLRGHGKIMFADLQDRVGKIQLFFQQNTLGEKMSETKLLDLGDIVEVANISQLKFTGRKLDQKQYHHYSGYLGGLKSKKMSEILVKNPGDVLYRAVREMLPPTKLRTAQLKRLIIK